MSDQPDGVKPLVALTIDGKPVQVPRGTTIWEAALEAGIEIPALCHSPRLRPVGVCRLCVVDIGERVLVASCLRPCEEGMEVLASSPEVEGHRKRLTALLMSDYHQDHSVEKGRAISSGEDLLLTLAERYGPENPYPKGRHDRPRQDLSSQVIAVNHQLCILCDRCIRACDEVQCNHIIGRTGKGNAARIAFDLDLPMGTSGCVSCGECMAVCPTAALTNKRPGASPRPGGKEA